MRILLATNGSQNSEAIMCLGCTLADRSSDVPTVLAVLPHSADSPPPPVELAMPRAGTLMDDQVLQAITKIRIGNPAEEIIREAVDGKYDLVVLGEIIARHWLSRLCRGSTVLRVIKTVPCPVVVAKARCRSIDRILVCDSGAASPQLLEQLTNRLPELFTGREEMTVLHVM